MRQVDFRRGADKNYIIGGYMTITKQEKSNNTEWKKRFDKNNRPRFSNHGMLGFWEGFWTSETVKMFNDFSNELSDKYKLALTHINYTVMFGWKFSFSLSGIVLVLTE